MSKEDHFQEEAKIILKFGNVQYNAFIDKEKIKVMCNIDDLDPITKTKSGGGSMIP